MGIVTVQKTQLIARKPSYRHGQLLLEDDFIAEQQFHSDARYRHARHLHGFGVVHGLEVTRASDMAINVSPGFAVDRTGHEIELREPETLELQGLAPGVTAWVTIGYRTGRPGKGDESDNRIDCLAFLRVATGVEANDVRLALLRMDDRGHLSQDAVNQGERDWFRALIAPGSVTAESLDAQLRSDWVSMAFHPQSIPRDERDFQPPFRVGATRAMAHKEYEDKPNTRGAAGTMGIMLPPGIRHIQQLRVAGEENEKGLTVKLLKGGFDPQAMRRLRDEIAILQIPPPGPFCVTTDIEEAHRSMADRHRTLSVEIRSQGFASISLVSLKVSY